MTHGRLSPSLRQRLLFLLAGNLLLLVGIAITMKQGGSFAEVLTRCGPNVAPVVLAGLGMTGIICTGAIDLSIASIIVVSGTVFGILVQRQWPPLPCFVGVHRHRAVAERDEWFADPKTASARHHHLPRRARSLSRCGAGPRRRFDSRLRRKHRTSSATSIMRPASNSRR
jgi:hypothetical protein